MKSLIIASVFSLLLISCAHHRDVRPGAEGVHKVVVRTDDKEKGTRSAISQANHFCEQSHRTAAFIDESQAYTGDMDEKDYQRGKKISNVAKVIGGTTWVFGGTRESNMGGIVGLSGVAADAALGKGYTITMKFKCQ
ncbi:MAG: hypothetical protein ACXWRA_09645 [Pseudobdellovibrionaceae bacterium]